MPTPTHPRVAIVTGAASGIGRAAALRLSAAGWRVAAVDRSGAQLRAVCERNPALHPYRCDVTDPRAVADTVAATCRDLGTPRRLVHAAGIAATGALLDHSSAELKRLMDVIYGGTVTVVQAVAPIMADSGGGQIVVFGSMGGWVPIPKGGAYGAAKAAVHFYAETLALEGRARGIQVLCVCPPAVETPMLGRLRAENPGMFGPRPGLPPEAVAEPMERALARGRLWDFPGRATRLLWVARRLAPRTLSAVIARHIVRQ